MNKKVVSKGSIKVIRNIDQINEVRKEPDPKLLWGGIPEGAVGLISGVAKTGKTTFAENLAISLAVGKKSFFGSEMDGEPRKVLFVNLEESYRIRCRRNDKQINRLSKDEFKLYCNNYITIPKDFPEFLNTDEDWNYLSKYIEAVDPDVIFMDSLSHMCIGEIEKSHVAQKFIQTFKKYVGSFEKTVIVVHHNVKGNEKPIDQNSIAGSRFITQTFQFAYGFANIPTGGNYMCVLNNKFIGYDTSKATLYSISNDGWLEVLEDRNKFRLYGKPQKIDGRRDSTNPDMIYKFIKYRSSQGSQTSQGNVSTTASDLMSKFVNSSTSTMSKDTLYKSLNKLELDGMILKVSKGEYKINDVDKNEKSE